MYRGFSNFTAQTVYCLDMRRHISKRTARRVAMTIAVLTLMVATGEQLHWFGAAGQPLLPTQPGLYAVTQFYDGDTLSVNMNGREEKVRLIGVDTPETHDPRKAVQCYGEAAAKFTRELVGTQAIRLEADPLNTNRDRYDRLLRYAYLPDNTLVNAEIIKQGYGFAYTSFPMTKASDFQRLQRDAMTAKRGLWGSCQPQQNEFGGYTSNDVSQ